MEWKPGAVFPRPKDPSDVADYKFDLKAKTNGSVGGYSDFLGSGETISDYTVTVADGITKDSDNLADSDTSVVVWLSGGSVESGAKYTDYLVTAKIVTSAGRTIERSAYVRVKQL